MGFDRQEVLKSVRFTGNIPEAMLMYIARNGCSGFKCKGCVLGLVCSHRPVDSVSYAVAVLTEVNKRLTFSSKAPSQPPRGH
jgi:hypothetical protein